MAARTRAKQSQTTPTSAAADAASPESTEFAPQRAAKLADGELEMARLFLAHNRTDIARRRLQLIVDQYGTAPAAEEARRLLQSLPRRPN